MQKINILRIEEEVKKILSKVDDIYFAYNGGEIIIKHESNYYQFPGKRSGWFFNDKKSKNEVFHLLNASEQKSFLFMKDDVFSSFKKVKTFRKIAKVVKKNQKAKMNRYWTKVYGVDIVANIKRRIKLVIKRKAFDLCQTKNKYRYTGQTREEASIIGNAIKATDIIEKFFEISKKKS